MHSSEDKLNAGNFGWLLLLLRATNGLIFTVHGWHKLAEFSQFAGGLAGLGFPWPSIFGGVATGLEFVGGLFLLLGIVPRIAALGHICIMIVAILAVHTPWKYGLTGDRGMEYPFLLLVTSTVILLQGGGVFSLNPLRMASRPTAMKDRESVPLFHRLLAGILGCLFLLIPVGLAQQTLGHDTEQEVISAEKDLWQKFERGDVQAMMSMLDHDFTAFSGSMPNRMDSREAEETHLRNFIETLHGKLLEYKIIDPHVQQFGRTAILSYLFSTTVSIQDAKVTRTGKQTSVWVRRDQGWRQVHYHYTYNAD